MRVQVHLYWNIVDRPLPPTVPVSGVANAAAPTTPIWGASLSRNAPPSAKTPTCIFGDSCAVSRKVGVIVPDVLLLAGWLKSGSYSHFVRSPAFLLTKMPVNCVPLPL